MPELKDFAQKPCHKCAPKEFRKVHDMTGSHELDAMIEHTCNGDMRSKLADYLTTDEAYGPLTGYSGYHGYRGDS